MAANKVTKVQRFADIISMLNSVNSFLTAVAEDGDVGEDVVAMLANFETARTSIDEAVDFIKHEMELTATKNKSKSKAESAENIKAKALIVDYLATCENGGGLTCTEIGNAIDDLSDYSTSGLSTLCNALVKDGSLIKAKVKGKSRFYIADGDADSNADGDAGADE